MFLVYPCSCLHSIHWSQVLSGEWRCSWSSADRRWSNYIWVINNFIAYWGATFIRGFTVLVFLLNLMGEPDNHFQPRFFVTLQVRVPHDYYIFKIIAITCHLAPLKSHALDKYPTMHHIVTQMCAHVHSTVTKCCIVGCGTSASWELCNGSCLLDDYYRPLW